MNVFRGQGKGGLIDLCEHFLSSIFLFLGGFTVGLSGQHTADAQTGLVLNNGNGEPLSIFDFEPKFQSNLTWSISSITTLVGDIDMHN